MAKIELNEIQSGFQTTTQVNTNFDFISSEFQEKVLYRDNPSGEPNQMENDLDMNGHRILNLLATTGGEFVWKGKWTASTEYKMNNLVYVETGSYQGSTYIALSDHTSGLIFDTDYVSSKWQTLAQRGGSGAGTGDMLSTNNLSDVADITASRTHIEAAKLGSNGDITELTALTNITTPTLTVATADKVVVKDADDSDKLKTATVAEVLALKEIPYSSAAENIAGTVENKAVDPLGIREAFNTTGSAPLFAIRAFANISTETKSGTYSQSGTTVTVTIASHGYSTGNILQVDITSGTGVDQANAVITVTGTNTFTYTVSGSATTSGNITIRNVIRASGNVTRIEYVSTGIFRVVLTTALPDNNYAVVFGASERASSSASGNCGLASDTEAQTTSTFLCRNQRSDGTDATEGIINFAVIR